MRVFNPTLEPLKTDFLHSDVAANSSYLNNETTATPTTEYESLGAFCEFNSIDNLTYLFGGIGIALALLLSFAAQRNRLRLDILHGRPALLIPVNLLEGRSNRHVYVLAFSAMTYQVLLLVFKSFTGTSSNPWTKTFVAVAYVFLFCGGFSIIVMAIEPPHRLLGYSLGIVYSLFWAIYRLFYHFKCDTTGIGVAPDVLLALPDLCVIYVVVWFGYKLVREIMWVTEGKSKSSTFREDPPYQMEYVRRTLAKPKIEVKDKQKKSWVARFITKHIYEWDPTFKYSTRMLITVAVSAVALWELTVAVSTFSHLLTDPLQSIDFSDSQSSSSEMSHNSMTLNPSTPTPMGAHSDPNGQGRGTATSTPMLTAADWARLRRDFNACLSLGVDAIRELGYASCDYKNETLIYYDDNGRVAKRIFISNPFSTLAPTPTADTTNNNNNNINSNDDNTGSETKGGESGVKSAIDKLLDFAKDFIKFFARAFPVCIGVSIAFSTTIVALHLPHLLKCYRKHMKRLYRGEKFFLPSSNKAPIKLVSASLKYSGFQIGYIVWGWVVMLVVLFFTSLVIAVLFKYELVSWGLVKGFLPTIVFTIIILVAQFVLAKFVLLQDRGSSLGVNNRRLFHMFGYFFFFYNTLIGIFSALRRLITSLVLGTIMLDRLDRSTLPRGWESLDKGFKSYVSFIVMEHEFCNPYVATFIYLLQQSRNKQSNKQTELVSAHTNSGGFITHKSRLNRNRWLVAYTLINNPALLANRRVDKLERASLITRSLSKTVSVNSTTALETVLLEEDYLDKPPHNNVF
ncbi:stimulated by retinoic acid gene 6 protein-like isoform X2 [Corticium candelabrum]|uniref:stimulated by retinoic acid gene 6 protein-like isoform X2 n=1 Tax=Corticium candelabrum TaxID=121492 RepID=UPI002E26BF77|nr:stimulated by retinoic acid gene 6 protein-like isoform X2 [Corticium candelabrum]